MALDPERYIVDEEGKKTAVVMSVASYRKLLRRLEELEDAVELDIEAKSKRPARKYADVRRELLESVAC